MGNSRNHPALKRALCLVVGLLVSLPASGRSARSAFEEPFLIVITRDIHDWLEPCDCKDGVLGGFPRRATVLRELPPDYLLDARDLPSQASPCDGLNPRFRLPLDCHLGLAVADVRRPDAGFSLGELGGVGSESPGRPVSAHLLGEAGEPDRAVHERTGTSDLARCRSRPSTKAGGGGRIAVSCARQDGRRGPRMVMTGRTYSLGC